MKRPIFSTIRKGEKKVSSSLIAAPLGQQVRHGWCPYLWYNRGWGKWWLPGPGMTMTDAAREKEKVFVTRSRQQWDYNRIDEKINVQSDFRKMDNRPDFGGPREFDGSYSQKYPINVNPPDAKPLHEYFDEYTKPGSDPKYEACVAVKEHWDAESFYYPGEAWKRNRPSFRSVPKEFLNKETFYHWTDWIFRSEEMLTTARPRQWNPRWPPPGYKVPKMVCKKEFVFGVEEPGLVHEIERYYWHRMWFENNCRQGAIELPMVLLLFVWLYWMARYNASMKWNMRAQFGNMWYPGRHGIRCYGEPRDPATDVWWWQEPMENKTSFPEQGVVWYVNEVRHGYARWCKERAERKKLEAVGV